MRMFTLAAILLLHSLLIPGGPAMAESPTKTLSPYFLIEGNQGQVENFPLKGTSVKTVINGVIADVRVTQRYANAGSRPINARYVFPASTRAAVHGMRMMVGDDVVVARIKERQAAKKEYREARNTGRSASLLEQQRPNVFTMDVANIMPGETVAIELHYSELLVPEQHLYAFVFPTVAGPRYSTTAEAGATEAGAGKSPEWVQTPYLASGRKPADTFSMDVVLAAGLPLQEVACDTHNTDITWESEAQANIKLATDDAHGGNRDFILNYRLSGDQIHTGLMLYEGETENFFMLMVQPPQRIIPNTIPDREYIFVVDVSGSMHGFPLDTAKALLKELIGTLRPTDRFNVILFAGAANVLAPQSLAASPENIEAALDHIDNQEGGGGTNLQRAVQKALALPRTDGMARSTVIVTDGFIAAEKEVFGLITDNLNQNNVFAFGIGSSVNRYLIEGLAKAGQGEPFIITDQQTAASMADRFKTYIAAPVLTNIHLDFSGFKAYDIEPKISADLFAQRPLVITGKWHGTPEGNIRLKGYTGLGPYEQTFTVSPHMDTRSSAALPYLWARTRLSRLSDFANGPDDKQVKEEVTQLGLKYSMLTAHTSFVAVYEKVRNTAGPARDVKQPLPLPHGVSNLAVGGRNVPEPDMVIMAVIFCLAAATAYRIRARRIRRSLKNTIAD